jgi:hypothetical protein
MDPIEEARLKQRQAFEALALDWLGSEEWDTVEKKIGYMIFDYFVSTKGDVSELVEFLQVGQRGLEADRFESN